MTIEPTHTGDTTQKNDLLATAQTDLDAAREANDDACDTYQYSHSIADRAAMMDAWNRMQKVEAQYREAYELLKVRELARMV